MHSVWQGTGQRKMGAKLATPGKLDISLGSGGLRKGVTEH